MFFYHPYQIKIIILVRHWKILSACCTTWNVNLKDVKFWALSHCLFLFFSKVSNTWCFSPSNTFKNNFYRNNFSVTATDSSFHSSKCVSETLFRYSTLFGIESFECDRFPLKTIAIKASAFCYESELQAFGCATIIPKCIYSRTNNG